MRMISHAATIGLLVLFGAVAAPSVAVAIELQPGLWQEVETGEENGQPVDPETSTSCMTPEEAKFPEKGLAAPKEAKDQCKSYDVKKTATTLTFRMQCGSKDFSIDIDADVKFVSATQYTGVFKSEMVFGRRKVSANKKIVAKRIGECKK